DDVGSDGMGPDHPNYPGPDPDGTEGNGMPDFGEPNFGYTDNHESDQIGLTSFNAAVWPQITAENDEDLWNRTIPGNFSEIAQTVDITFLYGSGYFPLKSGDRKKFAIAMLFGEDFDDILRNAQTMQQIYDSDYSFAMPPIKPTVTAVPGDGKVTLYWDKKAELSRDPIYGYDFEGYRIYRSTDPAFLESWVITDAWGNRTFNKPIAQFDIKNGLLGPHPVAFNGVQFDMGKDTGLVYSWTDTTVENGQTYYYAVTSYDQGYYYDFYERGINPIPNLQPISPAECTKIIEIDPTGKVIRTDVNTAVVTPNAPVAGYVPPPEISTENGLLLHTSGVATGYILISPLDPLKIPDGWEYQISFSDTTPSKTFSVRNMHLFTEKFLAKNTWYSLSRDHLVPSSIIVRDVGNEGEYAEGSDYEVDYKQGNIKLLPNSSMIAGKEYEISYQYYPVFESFYLSGEDYNPYFDGLKVTVNDDPLKWDSEKSGWKGKSNYTAMVIEFSEGTAFPADYEIQFKGTVGDTVSNDIMFNKPAPFIIVDITNNDTLEYVIREVDVNGEWSSGDEIVILKNDPTGILSPIQRVTWSVFLTAPKDSLVFDTTYVDTIINDVDTTIIDVDTSVYVKKIDPEAGDVYTIKIKKPFTNNDLFSFITTAAGVDREKAKDQLDRIAVVPNPYIVTASWEPQHVYTSGRGMRKIDFIHLPRRATIKIFTLRGYLVDTIEHNSSIDDGSASWDLISKDGMEIAYGIYIYHINAPGIGERIGKFAIIK
ncbi:MAG: hypothetical protein ACE5QV_07660, partial [Fidelibacterota bacterium]